MLRGSCLRPWINNLLIISNASSNKVSGLNGFIQFVGASYPSGHALHMPWLKSGWGADQSGSHQALSSRSFNVPCPCKDSLAKLLPQSCFGRALAELLRC